ncbi:MAG: hypothetical protein KTR28_02045 [Micavibrio sp.]|nr:hypothetical protein [Micavibrio sp.]
MSSNAFAAGEDVNNVIGNVQESVEFLPGLLAVFSYLIGIILGISAVLKFKEHVDAPQQTPLRTPIIRLIAGGAMFALPTIIDAAYYTIGGGNVFEYDPGSLANSVSLLLGAGFDAVGMPSINDALRNVNESTSHIPGLISLVSYLLGISIIAIGVLKIKDHVENPEQTRLKEGVARLLAGGALVAIPTIYTAMMSTIAGGGLDDMGQLSEAAAGVGMVYSPYGGLCDGISATVNGIAGGVIGAINNIPGVNVGAPPSVSMGQLVCGSVMASAYLPAFLSLIAYILGLVFGVWGIIKLRDHILEPQRTGLYEGVSRLAAGGAFFALPFVISILRATVSGPLATGIANLPANFNESDACGGAQSGIGAVVNTVQNIFNSITGNGGGGGAAASGGLDCMLSNFMSDMIGPMHIIINFFTFVAGLIFIMIGISRLIKTAQDGARGPGGIGTIMTFVVAGLLISYNEIMSAVSGSLFSAPLNTTYATLAYTEGMGDAEIASAHTVISAILKFVIVIGLISFVRGLFIIRSVAEGNQQASVMAGVTHIIAGAAAVNLGPLINGIQATLGIAQYGIGFGVN